MHALGFLSAALLACAAQPPFEDLVKRFANIPSQAAEEKIKAAPGRPGVRMFDYSFASPVDGRVSGVLISPARRGRFPLILYGHWMMKGSPLRNRNEFLEEAAVMARAGSICLLLDAPLVRTDAAEDPDPMHGQGPNATIRMVREWSRAIDLMVARPDVDPARIAYVGHSFNAGVGAKLAGVEKRIQSLVLMANSYSLRDYIYDAENAEMKAEREKLGEAWIQAYFEKFPWDDSRPFVEHSAPAAVFLQNGRLDQPIPERIVRKSFDYFQEPKRLEFYEAGHELNAAARRDRVEWLRNRLKLGKIDFKALDAIPPLR